MVSENPETVVKEERIWDFLEVLEEHGLRFYVADDGVFSNDSDCFAATL